MLGWGKEQEAPNGWGSSVEGVRNLVLGQHNYAEKKITRKICDIWRSDSVLLGCDIYQCFEGNCCLQLKGIRWRREVPPKCPYLFTRLQDVTFRKTIIFRRKKFFHLRVDHKFDSITVLIYNELLLLIKFKEWNFDTFASSPNYRFLQYYQVYHFNTTQTNRCNYMIISMRGNDFFSPRKDRHEI
jgi:hypothetical protein